MRRTEWVSTSVPRRREVPRDFDPNVGTAESDSARRLSDTEPADGFVFLGHSSYRPVNEYDAVMRCAPHEEPEVSAEERLELRDLIVDAIDELDEQQRWIFDALFVRRASLRGLAREINVPKTTLARWRDSLLVTLREKLGCDPAVADYLEGK